MYLFDCYVPAHYFFLQIVDYAIARSIVDLHMGRHGAEDTHTIYSVDNIRRYIAFARCFKPKVWNNFFTLLQYLLNFAIKIIISMVFIVCSLAIFKDRQKDHRDLIIIFSLTEYKVCHKYTS